MEKISNITNLAKGDKIFKGNKIYEIVEILSKGEAGYNSPEMDVYEVIDIHSNQKFNFYKEKLIQQDYYKL